MAERRMVIGLEPGADGSAVQKALLAAGAISVTIAPSQPDVALAVVSEGAAETRFLENARKAPGVRYVEPEAMRFSY